MAYVSVSVNVPTDKFHTEIISSLRMIIADRVAVAADANVDVRIMLHVSSFSPLEYLSTYIRRIAIPYLVHGSLTLSYLQTRIVKKALNLPVDPS